MYEIWSSAGLIWNPKIRGDDRAVTAAQMCRELKKAGSLSFTLPPVHVCFDRLPKLAAECWVLQDGEEIFRTRVLTSDRNMRNFNEVVCEGLLNVLNDERLRPGDLSSDGTFSGTAAGLIDKICAAYNARQTGSVPFARGSVDDFGTVKAEAGEYPKLGEFLDGVAEEYGGYLSVRRANGQNLLDYKLQSGVVGEQEIRFGENLLDFNEHATGEEIFTVVIPLGKTQDSGGRLTITDAAQSDGKDYIENTAAITALGVRVAKVVTFDEIDDADALYAAGAAVFSEGGGVVTSFSLSAVDLRDAGVNVDRLRLGNYYRVYSAPHGLDTQMPLTKEDIDLLRPADHAAYTIGKSETAMSEKQASQNRAANTAMSKASSAMTAASSAMAKANAAATPAQVGAAVGNHAAPVIVPSVENAGTLTVDMTVEEYVNAVNAGKRLIGQVGSDLLTVLAGYAVVQGGYTCSMTIAATGDRYVSAALTLTDQLVLQRV